MLANTDKYNINTTPAEPTENQRGLARKKRREKRRQCGKKQSGQENQEGKATGVKKKTNQTEKKKKQFGLVPGNPAQSNGRLFYFPDGRGGKNRSVKKRLSPWFAYPL